MTQNHEKIVSNELYRENLCVLNDCHHIVDNRAREQSQYGGVMELVDVSDSKFTLSVCNPQKTAKNIVTQLLHMLHI